MELEFVVKLGSELKAQMMQAVRHTVTLCDVVAPGQTDASDSL